MRCIESLSDGVFAVGMTLLLALEQGTPRIIADLEGDAAPAAEAAESLRRSSQLLHCGDVSGSARSIADWAAQCSTF